MIYFQCAHFQCGYCHHLNDFFAFTLALYSLHSSFHNHVFETYRITPCLKCHVTLYFKIIQRFPHSIQNLAHIPYHENLYVWSYTHLSKSHVMAPFPLSSNHSPDFCLQAFPLAILPGTQTVILTPLHKTHFFSFFSTQRRSLQPPYLKYSPLHSL